MISFQSVFFNGIWILGLSIMLAAFSYHYWLAGQESRQLRQQFGQPEFLRPIWFGFFLVGIGLVGTSQESWEMVIWGAVTLIALYLFISLYRQSVG